MKRIKIVLLNLYPPITMARYLLSTYLLKGYLLKYYKNSDLHIEIINFRNDTNEIKLYEKINDLNPNYIGYSCYIWNIGTIIKVLDLFKEKREIIHILGGPEISLKQIKLYRKPNAKEYYVIGEGERKFLNLIFFLENRERKLNFPKGTAFWDNNKLCYEKELNDITNLDEIPSIYLNEIIEERFYSKQQAFLETQRGCRMRCKYCVYSKLMPSINYYSLNRIFNELEYLILKKK